MVIDPTNLPNTTFQSKPERENTPDVIKESNINNQGIPETGQTSEIGPAVATNISAATLETSRAINAPDQTAGQSAEDDIITAKEKDQLLKTNVVPQSSRQNLIDTMV